MTLDPPPLCGLGGESLGRSVAISVNCPALLESPQRAAGGGLYPQGYKERGLTALLPMVVGCIPVSTDKHTH